jgi:hypothetical protein
MRENSLRNPWELQLQETGAVLFGTSIGIGPLDGLCCKNTKRECDGSEVPSLFQLSVHLSTKLCIGDWILYSLDRVHYASFFPAVKAVAS